MDSLRNAVRARLAGSSILCVALVACAALAPLARAAEAASDAAAAPTALAGKDALRARQAELFEALKTRPDDLDLMFAYAETSARLEDFEAAITTYERMLIASPNLPRVRLELGALHFAVGSYAASERYFRDVLETSEPPPSVRARIDAYLAEIDARNAPSRLGGTVSVGAVWASNANLGPDGRDVLLFGSTGALEGDAVEESDFGARAVVRLRHRYDLGGPRSDDWRTELSAFGLAYSHVEAGDVAAIGLRTGPKLALDDRQYGLKLRPFAEVEYLEVGRDDLYWTWGGGAEIEETLSDRWFAFGEGRVLYRDYFEPRDREDGLELRLALGAAYAPARDLVLRGGLQATRTDAEVGSERSTEVTARLGASYDYGSGLDFVDRKWNISGSARAVWRRFDEADAAVDPDETREDIDLGLSLAHTFALSDGFALVVDADYLARMSSIVNFELDNLTIGASLSYGF